MKFNKYFNKHNKKNKIKLFSHMIIIYRNGKI